MINSEINPTSSYMSRVDSAFLKAVIKNNPLCLIFISTQQTKRKIWLSTNLESNLEEVSPKKIDIKKVIKISSRSDDNELIIS